MKDLNTILNSIDISADWIGLREVCENKTFRYIRDMNPQSNTRSSSHGVMVEVLSNGQFGYYGCNNPSQMSLQNAAEKALQQAKAGRLHILDKITETINEPRSNLKPHTPKAGLGWPVIRPLKVRRSRVQTYGRHWARTGRHWTTGGSTPPGGGVQRGSGRSLQNLTM